MSTQTNPETFRELYIELLNRTREDTGQSATVDIAKRYINMANYELHMGMGEKLEWCIREAVLITKDKYSTGTITANRGSATVGGVDTVFDSLDDFGNALVRRGGLMKFDGVDDVYRVRNVGNPSLLTLEGDFVQTSLPAGTAYEYFEDQYALASDFERPVDMNYFDGGRQIPLIGRSEFRRRYTRNSVPGKPIVATMVSIPSNATTNTNQSRAIRFAPPPDTAMNFPYSYVTNLLANRGTATGNVKFIAIPADTETLVLAGVTWTFKTTPLTSAQTEIQPSIIATVAQLAADLNASTTEAIGRATYYADQEDLVITYDTPGDLGEAFTITTTTTATITAMANQAPISNMVGDDDTPIVPVPFRSALVDLATYHWYLHRKDDTRAAQARQDADAKLGRVIDSQEIGAQRPRIHPNIANYKRSARRPWGGGGGNRYDINGRFDRMED